MTKISVIVPCYNQAQYLDETLQSVLDQSYTDWECIIVNDGSPDNTRAVAEKWCKGDNRYKYLEKENGGLSSARNAGIEIAKGEWILPLDSDDRIGTEYITLAINVMEKNPNAGIIYCNAEFFGEKKGKWELKNFDIKTFLSQNLIFCSAFYKKEDWKIIGGYDIKLKDGREDWEFWISLLKITNKEVFRIDYTGFFYRIKEESMITQLISDSKKIQNTELYIYDKHKDFYTEQFGSFIEVLKENNRIKNENKYLLESLSHIKSKVLYKIFNRISRIIKIDII